MPTEDALLGLGMAPQLADFLGTQPVTLAGTGTAQTGAKPLITQSVELTTSGGQTAFLLTDVGVNVPVTVVNSSATAALVFPPSGQTMNGTLNASFSVAQWKPAVFVQYKKGFWTVSLSA